MKSLKGYDILKENKTLTQDSNPFHSEREYYCSTTCANSGAQSPTEVYGIKFSCR